MVGEHRSRERRVKIGEVCERRRNYNRNLGGEDRNLEREDKLPNIILPPVPNVRASRQKNAS